jgi:hypothetical protein
MMSFLAHLALCHHLASIVVVRRKLFQKSSPLKVLVQLKPNLIFLKFHPHFFLFLAWRPSWLEVGITGHKFGRVPSKDHSTKVWLQLTLFLL